jgi:amino acid adenylation domain-containing protein/non-ribosomal peptide synthase protein (TIGR01720 family)
LTPPLHERIENLSPAKQALLKRMLAESGGKAIPVVPRTTAGPLPLSFAQQRLWFLEQMEPGVALYNVPAALRVEGPLNRHVLERSMREVIRRHEILRTVYRDAPDGTVQVVKDEFEWQLAFEDLSSQSRPGAGVHDVARREAEHPVDLRSELPIRARLLRVSSNEHWLVLVVHHLACDGRSISVICDEIARIYAASVDGQPSPLIEPALQYADFVEWQRRHASVGAGDAHLAYWRSKLRDCRHAIELPTDSSRSDQTSFQAGSTRKRIPRDLAHRLEQLAATSQATPFMVLLAAWKVLLARYSGQADVCVGTPVANRRRAELQSVVGLFVNTVVLRTDMCDNPTLRELIARVRQTTLEADEHQELPFEQLIDDLQPQRELGRTPVVNTMFVQQNLPAALNAGDVSISEVDLSVGSRADFDLTLNVIPTSRGLELLLVYRQDLYVEATAARLLDNYETLLLDAVQDPDRPIGDLCILSARERSEVLVDRNETQRPYPDDKCLHEVIRERATRSPETPAIEAEQQTLTYGELERRANQLAHYLRSVGATRDAAVGILLERSADAIMAFLAVLKAGAAYLPLDPAYPTERLTYMLRDAEANIVITHGDRAASIREHDLHVVSLDTEAAAIAKLPTLPPHVDSTPGDLAYLIYTSGSTGQPKAVEVPHRGLVNHAVHSAERIGIQPQDRVIQCLSLSFDASGDEIYPALVAGATLVIHPDSSDFTPRQTLQFCRDHRATILHLVAPVWHGYVDELRRGGAGPFLCLKTVIVGGDAVSPTCVQEWCRVLGKRVRLFVAYGVTEATITSTLYEVPVDFPQSPRVPIGTPLANHRLYVLDERQRPVPIGVPGELFIGGVGVARGYRNQPDLTRARYLQDPFVEASDARMYRTGDRVRWRVDGNLEFLGRVDQQVKIRGYRVEPAEVEAVLTSLADVVAARVIVREDVADRRQLVAYVVTEHNVVFDPAILRDRLGKQLPAHMLPAALVEMDRLPLRPGGKVDDAALPAPDWHSRSETEAYVPPTSPNEIILAQIWSDVLGLEKVSATDNFFQLGGDSIISLQVISRANAAGLLLTPKQLFQFQTVRELAAAAGKTANLPTQEPVTGDSPLSPVQAFFFHSNLPQRNHFNQAVLLTIEQQLPFDVLRRAFAVVLRHHDVFSSRFAQGDGEWCQQYGRGLPPAAELQRFDVSNVPDAELSTTIEGIGQQLHSILNIETGTLCAAAYFDLGSGRRDRLLIVTHHLVVDGVSWRILIDDLSTATRQLVSDEKAEVSLPAKTTSFKSWVESLIEVANDARLSREIGEWLDHGTQRSPVSGRVDSMTHRTGDAEQLTRVLDRTISEGLLTDAHLAYRTRIDHLLISALARTWARWKGARQVRVDWERHGRESSLDNVDVSRTVGWFTSLVPLWFEISPEEDPGNLICETKEIMEQLPAAGLGYGLARWLCRDPEIRAKAEKIALAEVSINHLGRFDVFDQTDQVFGLVDETIGPLVHAGNPRWHPLEFLSCVRDGQLHVMLVYDRNDYNRADMEALVDGYTCSLDWLVTHCRQPTAGRLVPADFPLAEADAEDLAALGRLFENSE